MATKAETLSANFLPRAIIFDLDGTFYTGSEKENLFREIQKELALGIYGKNCPPEKIEEFLKSYNRLVPELGYKAAYEELGGKEETRCQITENFDHAKFLNPNPRLKEALTRLKEMGIILTVVTGNTQAQAKAILKKILGDEALDLFSNLTTRETEGVKLKPSTCPFYIAFVGISQVVPDLATKDCFVIGDVFKSDIEPALMVGMSHGVLIGEVKNVPEGYDSQVFHLRELDRLDRFLEVLSRRSNR